MRKFAIAFVHLLSCAFAIPLADETDWRIVGGSDAPDGAYPYQVSMRGSEHDNHFCGGSIISPSWILTAAHCVEGESRSSFVIVVGTNQLNAGGTRYQVSEIIAHEDYDPKSIANDIALIKLSDPITYGPKVKAIGLTTGPVYDSTLCVLSGWGLTSFPSKDVPNNLQHISLSTIGTTKCQKALSGTKITDYHVCTISIIGEGACIGDSGGPLVYEGDQIGIVSFGVPCAKGHPDVFTSVAAYRDWIREHSGV